jgi:hypothetical protein
MNTLSLALDDIAADVAFLENTDLTDLQLDVDVIKGQVSETNATANATAIAMAALTTAT